jgi:NADH-ubiquinone oxidoreductase chain 5
VFFFERNYSYTVLNFWKEHDAENWDQMYVALFCLIFLSITSGFIFNDMFLGYGSNFWNNSIYFFNNHFLFLDVEFIHPLIKNLPILLSFFNMFFFYLIFSNLYWVKYNLNKSFFFFSTIFTNISPFFYYAMFFNKLYNKLYSLLYNYSYLIQVKCVDKGLLELIGPFGSYKFFRFLHINFNNFISPLLFNYLFIFFLNLFIFLVILFLIFNNYFFIFNNYLGLIIIYFIIIFINIHI